ncbi:chemotaxis-specific protein-glutamate methyltransferase CheB [Anaeromyxobacter dehalogenans]|uniref:Protein-glutamate methylesterase/protein-glutamine glutaminase 2 n=1 Tax=Anaeromyxobacter dehalogenans (strain 2CP-C) TaxID=290397 RepID=CHEB2_ANADE|nr:chemotaxis-specific protein-glutamate methyltransferase CheB [Anaeromyxobacter dehalogenans]Q2INL1.1 RecName: Full=Protein-glutamate methylesterase/protein-glutamine glutaminase 2 [Anaeromyxobacter dehalogenans 2CP-C]ABC80390.1 response regulator receiver (CheY-like) modulated CheB methylesterase [Anaeromyxobacter dehalogenans 2CP-C]
MSLAGGDRPIRVLVADDSELFRELLARVVAAEPGFEVAAVAADGDAAAAMARALRPDVVTMDLHMPDADGYSGIARIMAETPTPILVLTANPTEAAGFRALSLGALDILEKPSATADLGEYGRLIRSRLRLLAGVKVIRHLRGLRERRDAAPARAARVEVVVIGASLGGPRALAAVLRGLPPDFPAPIAVVQHIADGFTAGLAGWLAQESRLDVREARHGDPLRAGRVLIAPSGRHLVLGEGVARLSDAPPVDTFRPSVTPLFTSAARQYGRRCCGVLLTGMGRDGAEGLRVIKDAGGPTLAQDEATSAVFGMARAAVELGAVDRVLPVDEIPRALRELTR